MTLIDLTIQGYPVKIWQADTQAEMTKGLIGIPKLDDDEGLMLPSGSGGIHTVGMRMPIDVIWMDRAGNTIAIDVSVPPNIRIPKRADFVIELQGGWFKRHGLQSPGQTVSGDCGCGGGCGSNGQHVGQGLAERRGRMRSRRSVSPGARSGFLSAWRGPQRLMSPMSRVGQGLAEREFGKEFDIGWHGNDPHGPQNWQRGGRGEGWGPAHHGWQWGATHQVGADPHLYGMHTPHGPLVQFVGQPHGGGGGGGHTGPAPHAHGAPSPHGRVPFGGGGPQRPRPPQVPHPHGGHHPPHPHPHPHHPRPPHHHDHDHDGWFGFGVLWPWWDWGFSCDPCDPGCLVYDPTLDCDALQAGPAQVEGNPYTPPSPNMYAPAPMQR